MNPEQPYRREGLGNVFYATSRFVCLYSVLLASLLKHAFPPGV